MNGIFISYRRADTQGWAGRLGADLARAFGEEARYFDMTSVPPGTDYVVSIERALADAAAVLVLIGPQWLTVSDAAGTVRLNVADDLVAKEVELALARNAPVVPVLLGGATMPSEAALPAPLKALARRNAIELSDSRWAHDLDRLMQALEAETKLRRKPVAAAGQRVSVAADACLRDSRVGRVTGVRGASTSGDVDVLQRARLTNVEMGDITGIDLGPADPPASKP